MFQSIMRQTRRPVMQLSSRSSTEGGVNGWQKSDEVCVFCLARLCTQQRAIELCAIECVCSSNRNYLKQERAERESVPMKKTRGERTCSVDIRVLITVV